MPKSRWTQEAELLLRELWAKGYSAARCSIILGVEINFQISRSAALGKLHRMGLRHAQQPVEDKPPKPERKIEPKPLAFRNTRYIPPPSPPLTVPPDKIWKPLAGVTPVYLCNANSTHCRWPVDVTPGEHFVCGAAKDLLVPYCTTHTNVAWTPLTKQQKSITSSLRLFAL